VSTSVQPLLSRNRGFKTPNDMELKTKFYHLKVMSKYTYSTPLTRMSTSTEIYFHLFHKINKCAPDVDSIQTITSNMLYTWQIATCWEVHNNLCFKNKFCLQGVKFGERETVYPSGIGGITQWRMQYLAGRTAHMHYNSNTAQHWWGLSDILQITTLCAEKHVPLSLCAESEVSSPCLN
jgi:hypothetical protein